MLSNLPFRRVELLHPTLDIIAKNSRKRNVERNQKLELFAIAVGPNCIEWSLINPSRKFEAGGTERRIFEK
jgi:hypothetical protein